MIVVTGGLGFIGAHTVRALASLGQRCLAATRSPVHGEAFRSRQQLYQEGPHAA
jgi:UDP-glucose 4-epimerase